MDYYDREYISALINYFWGEGTASPHSVNSRAVKVAYKALEEVQSCSASMDLVPRPSGGQTGLSYIVKQLSKIGKRIMSGDSSVYHVCKVKVSVTYKTEMVMALSGI